MVVMHKEMMVLQKEQMLGTFHQHKTMMASKTMMMSFCGGYERLIEFHFLLLQ